MHSGVGDLHTDEPRYNDLSQSVEFVDLEQVTGDSPQYTLTLYPNNDFFEVYRTVNPWIGCFGSVAVFIFALVFFGLYDFMVLRDARAKQELLAAKRHFMRFVSHEVRTPLNSVCMGLELVQKEISESLGFESIMALENHLCSNPTQETQEITETSPSTPTGSEANYEPDEKSQLAVVSSNDAKEWFTLAVEIRQHAQSAVSVLSDLLNYDKVEAGKLSIEREPLQIFPLIATIVDEFRLSAENKHLQYGMSLGAERHDAVSGTSARTHVGSLSDLPRDVRSLYVIGDNIRLQQVLRNFLSNAIKFSMSSGSVNMEATWEEVHQTTSEDKECILSDGTPIHLTPCGRIVVKVTDSGAGMTPEQLGELFKAGTQFNANKLQAGGGSGLGLFISKEIVELHGGKVWAESEGLDKGTTFNMSLLVYSGTSAFDNERAVDNVNSHYSPDMPGASEELKCPRTVLVVDDVQSNRKLLARLLTKNGDRCEMAVDGEDCLDKVASASEEGRRYDIILLDYEMPNLNGPDCAKRLRASGCCSLIVGLTGNCLQEDVMHFKSCGADDVLPKPFKMNDLQTIWERQGLSGAHVERIS